MNERQAFLAIRNAVRLEDLSTELAQAVAPQLRAIFNELGNQFRRLPPGDVQREIWYRQQRLRIADMLAPVSVEMRDQMIAALGKEVAMQMRYAEEYLRIAGADPANLVAAASPQDGIGVDVASVSDDGVELLTRPQVGRPQFTQSQLAAITQETRVLGERLEDLFEPVIGHGEVGPWIRQNINTIDRVVKAGFLTGQTNEQIAQQLPGVGREAIARNKAIARTAVMDMSAKAQEAMWLANEDVIEAFEFDATLDNRVCPQCAPWHGEVRKKRSQLPMTPVHVNCRCSVLPVADKEVLPRDESGPQRRTVVDLIDAPSKEKAIAKAKLKPGAVGARAYATQVKVKGKKYWKVAVEMEQKGKAISMGEYLKQASPTTQAQVLGSNKRREIFLRKITGDKNNPPMSPDRALKEAVDWKPTVSRRPRMDAQLKLDINKLKDQKAEMKLATQGDRSGIYAYLRGKDSPSGKEGTPYYIGKMANERRPWGRHNTPVPRDPRRVRLLRGNLTNKQANQWEKYYIARYGRIDNNTGSLRNLTDGGEGVTGNFGYNSAQVRWMAESARKYGIGYEAWARLTQRQRNLVHSRYRSGKRGKALLEGLT